MNDGKESGESPPMLTAATTVSASAELPSPPSSVHSDPPALPAREHLIVTAIKFLNNPNVVRSAVDQKQAFLRSKGLTEHEIQIACERAGVFTMDPNAIRNQTVISMGVGSGGSCGVVQQRPSFLTRVKDVLSSVALFSGIAYGLYLFYKRFIEPLLFRGKKKKTVDEQLTELSEKMTSKIDSLNDELLKIKDELNRVNQVHSNVKELGNFKTDLDSIKGLLLNRKQFAAPILPVVPPSIPAWQLRSQQHQQPSSEGEPDKNDDNDTGSGSGSSENDVVLKNSDSSLEIIS